MPVLPVRHLDVALDHYARLGFDVRRDKGGGYGYATRDGVQIHLSRSHQHDPESMANVVYLYVDAADALYTEWCEPGITAGVRAPVDTEWRMREGAHIDPDGNLIRFGHHLR